LNQMGIGVQQPVEMFEVALDMNVDGSVNSAGVPLTSDKRLKKDIKEIGPSLSKVENIKGQSFKWNGTIADRPEGRQLGFIAQDMQKIYPEVVDKGKDGYFALSYTSLIAPVIEAIKELAMSVVSIFTDVHEAKRELATLRAENQELRAMLCEDDPAAPGCGRRN